MRYTAIPRSQVFNVMDAYGSSLPLPTNSKTRVVAAAYTVDGDLFCARNWEQKPPSGHAQHAEALLWMMLQEACIPAEKVTVVCVSSPDICTPLFPCGGCRDYLNQWPLALFVARTTHVSVEATKQLVCLPVEHLLPWHYHAPTLQTRAALHATVLPSDHTANVMIERGCRHLKESYVRLDRGMLRMAMVIYNDAGDILPVACMQQISGYTCCAAAAACAVGAAYSGALPQQRLLKAVVVLGDDGGKTPTGLFVPPLGIDLDFLAHMAGGDLKVPVYIHNPVSQRTLCLLLQDLFPGAPNLWSKGAPLAA